MRRVILRRTEEPSFHPTGRLTGPPAFLALLGVWALSLLQTAAQDPTVPHAPVRGFVYLEPFEVRTEFLVRANSLPGAVEYLGGSLSGARRTEALDRMERSLQSGAATVVADGVPLRFEPVQTMFVTLDEKLGPVPDTREEIPVDEAVVAAVFAAPTPGFPASLEVGWSLFAKDQERVQVVVEALERAQLIDADFSETLTFLRGSGFQSVALPAFSAAPGLVQVAPPTSGPPELVPWLVVTAFTFAGAVLLWLALRKKVKEPGTVYVGAALSLLFAGGAAHQTLKAGGTQLPADDRAPEMVGDLLKNVYHAFAFREESAIYDTLARSVDGPLLESLYIDIRNAIEGDDDAPAVRVLDVTIIDCVTRPSGDRGGMRANVAWASRGTVSHLGHSHTRHNNYRAELLIEPVDGAWKITGVEFEDIERI